MNCYKYFLVTTLDSEKPISEFLDLKNKYKVLKRLQENCFKKLGSTHMYNYIYTDNFLLMIKQWFQLVCKKNS